MNLPKLQALVAPLTAPIPSALGVAFEAYSYSFGQTESIFFGWLAGLGAFVGIETLGGASCYALVKLHRQHDYGIEFWLALAGIVAYVGSGWYTLVASPVIIFFFLAPFSYFAYSILRSMEREIEDKIDETEAQIKLINAQKNLINAETRKTKAAIRPVQGVQLDTGHPSSPSKECRLDVRQLLDSDPHLSARQIAKALNISPTTASEHKKLWNSRNGVGK